MNAEPDPGPDTDKAQKGPDKPMPLVEDASEHHQLSAHKGYETAKRLAKKLRETAQKLSFAEWSTVFFTAVIAIATVWNVRVISGQLSEMRVEQRAWIAPISSGLALPFPSKIGDSFYYAVYYVNSGKDPALELKEFHEAFWIIPSGGKLELLWPKDFPNNDTCPKVTEDNGSGVIWPMIPGMSPLTVGPMKADAIVADDGFVNRHKILGIHGCFSYETAGQTRHSGYCFLLRPTQIGNEPAPIAQWTWGFCPGINQNFAD